MNVPLLIQAATYNPQPPPADSVTPFQQYTCRKRLKECTDPSTCSYFVTESAIAKEGAREGGKRVEEEKEDFNNYIPCPSVPYFKGTHCEHILVCTWCIYIFFFPPPLLPSPPEATMVFFALLFYLPTSF